MSRGAVGVAAVSTLVVASVVYSMPFVVQPLQQAFEAIGETTLEAAATLRAGAWDRFLHVALPLARPGLLTAIVLGFYLLVAMGPNGPLGRAMQFVGLPLLPFTFAGLVVASVFYSMPFVVQPLQQAFEAIGETTLEVAATLRAGAWDRFFHVALPLARPGLLTAIVLGFAHTVGEFGVVLMIGGNIPGQTRVLSVLIYDHVEALDYAPAHVLSLAMVAFSFLVLLLLYVLNPGWRNRTT